MYLKTLDYKKKENIIIICREELNQIKKSKVCTNEQYIRYRTFLNSYKIIII